MHSLLIRLSVITLNRKNLAPSPQCQKSVYSNIQPFWSCSADFADIYVNYALGIDNPARKAPRVDPYNNSNTTDAEMRSRRSAKRRNIQWPVVTISSHLFFRV